MQFKVTANFSLTLILISILGCQSTQPVKLTAEELTKISEGWSAAPVSYSGEASCPDCQNPRYQLNLLPGKVYLLKTTALAKEQSADNITDSMGRWELKDNLLTLNDGSGSVKSLTIIDADTLRMPVPNAKPETEQANQDLVRTQQFQALESHRTLSGIYSEKSGSATIERLQTGLTFPLI